MSEFWIGFLTGVASACVGGAVGIHLALKKVDEKLGRPEPKREV